MYSIMLMSFFFFFFSNLFMFMNFFFSSINKMDREKSSSFECGFDPFNSSRLPFSIQFYMISVIFLIFDVEIIIFLPMIESYKISIMSKWLMTIFMFIFILFLGLLIEWKDGALFWLK
nr:NADH deshydrogenase subunit 3 [Euceros kiushuensis]